MNNRQLNFSQLLYLTAHHWRLELNRRLKDLGMSQANWGAASAITPDEQLLTQLVLEKLLREVEKK
ncbi:TPA: hypothetical protein IGZ65_004752 [Escherichia coli]|nr:hypothetical protein [Escherichia coli]